MDYAELLDKALGAYADWRGRSDQAKTQASIAQQQLQAQMAMQAQAQAAQRNTMLMMGGFALVAVFLIRS